jgi:hypothetical protein
VKEMLARNINRPCHVAPAQRVDGSALTFLVGCLG